MKNVFPWMIVAALLLWVGYEYYDKKSPIEVTQHIDSVRALKEIQRVSAVRIDSIDRAYRIKIEKDSIASVKYEARIKYWTAKAKQIKIKVDTIIKYPDLDTLLHIYDSIIYVQAQRIHNLNLEKGFIIESYEAKIKEKDEIIKTGFEINSHMDAVVAELNKDLAKQKKYKIGGTIVGGVLGFIVGRGTK